MNCYIYRSNKQKGMYLYLGEKDNFSRVPESLINLLGDMDFTFEFNLSKGRKLVRAEATEVMRIIKENGYFLQMPPPKGDLLREKAN